MNSTEEKIRQITPIVSYLSDVGLELAKDMYLYNISNMFIAKFKQSFARATISPNLYTYTIYTQHYQTDMSNFIKQFLIEKASENINVVEVLCDLEKRQILFYKYLDTNNKYLYVKNHEVFVPITKDTIKDIRENLDSYILIVNGRLLKVSLLNRVGMFIYGNTHNIFRAGNHTVTEDLAILLDGYFCGLTNVNLAKDICTRYVYEQTATFLGKISLYNPQPSCDININILDGILDKIDYWDENKEEFPDDMSFHYFKSKSFLDKKIKQEDITFAYILPPYDFTNPYTHLNKLITSIYIQEGNIWVQLTLNYNASEGERKILIKTVEDAFSDIGYDDVEVYILDEYDDKDKDNGTISHKM